MTQQVTLNTHHKKESGPLANLIFSIILPVLILNQLSDRLGESGPWIALLIALFFPIGLGLYDLIRIKKWNFFSLLGIVSVLLTGGLALLKLSGEWFVIKEASIPLVLGIFVLGSALSKTPVIELFFFNEKIFHLNLIREKLKKENKERLFQNHLKTSTLLLSASFFLSATLNYLLAHRIFTQINPSLNDIAKATVLNDQIAQMTWKSYLIILIPSLVFLSFILWYLFHGIRKLTGLSLEEVVKTPQ